MDQKIVNKEYENISVKVKNLLCFNDEFSGFDEIKPINIIIGRNNSGKSTLLEMIQMLCLNPKSIWNLNNNLKSPEIIIGSKLNEFELKQVFREDVSGGSIPAINHWEYGKKWVGKTIYWIFNSQGYKFLNLETQFDFRNQENFEVGLVNIKKNTFYFNDKTFKRLLPERDIQPEKDTDLVINSNAQGITNHISKFLNYAQLPSHLIEEILLAELNKIFEPDIRFTSIDTQKLENDHWEIFLGEKGKGKIALSRSGSGLKTVIAVLSFLYLIPQIEKRNIHDYVFAFEELENNLHPAVQRRLFAYLKQIALEKNCMFFITTHSNVVIDLFSNDKDAQIIHVKHNGEYATAERALTYIEHKGILDDLDVRASDLLQSNCVVWLEGPSDRLYFNKWIELWSDGELREGVHYQCVFYGGRLLAHLSANDPSENLEYLVKILRVNRNAILLIDSDKTEENDVINNTKKRILTEINEVGGFGWVTQGKEIENYLPKEAIEIHLNLENVEQIRNYELIDEYLDKLKPDEGKKFTSKKVMYAEYFTSHFTKENLNNILDIDHKMKIVCDNIKKWNGISK